jgi:hypothetical protein
VCKIDSTSLLATALMTGLGWPSSAQRIGGDGDGGLAVARSSGVLSPFNSL